MEATQTRVPESNPSPLGRVGAWCYDHRRRVLLLWIVGVVLIIGIGTTVGSRFLNNFGGSGQSQQVQDLLHQRFPAQAGDSAQVVFQTSQPLASPTATTDVNRVLQAVRPLPRVTSVSPLVPSADGHIGFATIQFDNTAAHLPNADVKRVMNVARSFAHPGFEVALGGDPISNVVSPSPGSSEGIGITAAIIIMLVAFGSVVAMGLPILIALVGVGIGFAVVDLVSHALTVPSFGPELMAMIGLGVGIDYALFIVTRYRQGLGEGRNPRDAIVVAQATAGRAVLFAGTTVIISLLGLLLVGQAYLVGLAVGTILAVLLVMAATLSLLPAMLGFAGRAIDRLHVPGLLRSAAPGVERGFWWRWSRTVQRRPALCGMAALAVLVLLSLPLFSMRLAFSDAGNDPTNLTTRHAYDLLARGFGPGFNGPLVVAAELPGNAAGRATLAAFDQRLATVPGVARTQPPVFNPAGNAAVVIVYPTTAPQDAATASLVKHLRSTVIPDATRGTGVSILVGGETAAGVDASSGLSSRLPLVIGLVIGLSFLLLMTVFRSIAIPLKAAVMNLLSIGAAYGVITAVYQWGWLSSIFSVPRTGPIDPWIPLMMFTITFGLSMDYEVFLLSRIQEEWRRTGNNSLAVADGLAATGRVITAAAAIMVCVFGSFVIGDPLRILDVFGLGLAAAILVDATLVRMVLVPSIMQVLGRANWWLPRWLDHRLPTVTAEAPARKPEVVTV
ncbi:MAG: MMPL family transporter [Acidimicrobiaceae bacterium]|nr:MMPL family transporter [Acidimicrobiaceae bacterium]